MGIEFIEPASERVPIESPESPHLVALRVADQPQPAHAGRQGRVRPTRSWSGGIGRVQRSAQARHPDGDGTAPSKVLDAPVSGGSRIHTTRPSAPPAASGRVVRRTVGPVGASVSVQGPPRVQRKVDGKGLSSEDEFKRMAFYAQLDSSEQSLFTAWLRRDDEPTKELPWTLESFLESIGKAGMKDPRKIVVQAPSTPSGSPSTSPSKASSTSSPIPAPTTTVSAPPTTATPTPPVAQSNDRSAPTTSAAPPKSGAKSPAKLTAPEDETAKEEASTAATGASGRRDPSYRPHVENNIAALHRMKTRIEITLSDLYVCEKDADGADKPRLAAARDDLRRWAMSAAAMMAIAGEHLDDSSSIVNLLAIMRQGEERYRNLNAAGGYGETLEAMIERVTAGALEAAEGTKTIAIKGGDLAANTGLTNAEADKVARFNALAGSQLHAGELEKDLFDWDANFEKVSAGWSVRISQGNRIEFTRASDDDNITYTVFSIGKASYKH